MISPEYKAVEMAAREIAQKINDDARRRLVCSKPEYDTIDMGEMLISKALATARREALKAAVTVADEYDTGGWGQHDNMVAAQRASSEIRDAIRALIDTKEVGS